MKKADRQIVFDKYKGRCAYCGEPLQKGWHVDEVDPVIRVYKTIPSHYRNKNTKLPLTKEEKSLPEGQEWIDTIERVPDRRVLDRIEYPENFKIGNQMPSCASCNINKHSGSLEAFRSLIQGFMKHLNEVNTQYKIAKRYGLVSEHIKPVKFFFEKFKAGTCTLCKEESNCILKGGFEDYCEECEEIAERAELN